MLVSCCEKEVFGGEGGSEGQEDGFCEGGARGGDVTVRTSLRRSIEGRSDVVG